MLSLWCRSTAKIWKNFECAYELIDHTASVWAVLALEDDQYLTGMFRFDFSMSRLLNLFGRLCGQNYQIVERT